MANDVDLWRVVEATFECSAPTVAQVPGADRPEFAIAGRSNVGKSSLLNALCGRSGLARVSSSPGRTRLLNVFTWTLVGPNAQRLNVRGVDLPGYGFAAVDRRTRESFGDMVENYLLQRPSLVVLLVLLDARRGVDVRDHDLLEFIQRRSLGVLVVGTKADKLTASERGLWVGKIAEDLGIPRTSVHLSSAKTGIGIRGQRGVVDALARYLAPS